MCGSSLFLNFYLGGQSVVHRFVGDPASLARDNMYIFFKSEQCSDYLSTLKSEQLTFPKPPTPLNLNIVQILKIHTYFWTLPY